MTDLITDAENKLDSLIAAEEGNDPNPGDGGVALRGDTQLREQCRIRHSSQANQPGRKRLCQMSLRRIFKKDLMRIRGEMRVGQTDHASVKPSFNQYVSIQCRSDIVKFLELLFNLLQSLFSGNNLIGEFRKSKHGLNARNRRSALLHSFHHAFFTHAFRELRHRHIHLIRPTPLMHRALDAQGAGAMHFDSAILEADIAAT